MGQPKGKIPTHIKPKEFDHPGVGSGMIDWIGKYVDVSSGIPSSRRLKRVTNLIPNQKLLLMSGHLYDTYKTRRQGGAETQGKLKIIYNPSNFINKERLAEIQNQPQFMLRKS